MAHILGSMMGDEFELGYIFKRMVKGMRNKMSMVLRKIEKSSNMSTDALKNVLKWFGNNEWSSGESHEWYRGWNYKGEERSWRK
jgi:hypothetical protein